MKRTIFCKESWKNKQLIQNSFRCIPHSLRHENYKSFIFCKDGCRVLHLCRLTCKFWFFWMSPNFCFKFCFQKWGKSSIANQISREKCEYLKKKRKTKHLTSWNFFRVDRIQVGYEIFNIANQTNTFLGYDFTVISWKKLKWLIKSIESWV